MRLMGLPAEEMPLFLEWEEGLLRGKTMADRAVAARSIKDYLIELIAARRAKRSNDLVSFVVDLQIDGQPISDERALGICYLFYVAGLDTVASTLGSTFRELAEQPELQRQLRAEPALIGDAVEEFVRAFGVVVDYRYLTQDHEFHGVRMRKGDLIELPLGVGSRDPKEYPDPHRIDFRRENTRSITFAAGPHRCIGSHLARREFRIALEEWTTRVPEFRIKPGDKPRVQAESVWGVSYLPLVW
jgi:cytochrome P450